MSRGGLGKSAVQAKMLGGESLRYEIRFSAILPLHLVSLRSIHRDLILWPVVPAVLTSPLVDALTLWSFGIWTFP